MTATLIGLLVGAMGFVASLFLPVPQNLRTAFDAGQSLYVLGEYEGAIQQYLKVVEFENDAVNESKVTVEFGEDVELPVKAAAWYQLGNSYKKSDREEEAVEAYRQILDAPDVSGDFKSTVQFQIADARFAQEEYEQAAIEYDRFVERFPNSEFVGKAYYYGGWSQFRLGHYGQAIEVLTGMLETMSEDRYAPDAQFRIANSYYELGEYDKAINTANKMLEIYSNSPVIADAGYLKAQSYDKLGRYEEAIASFNNVIELYDKMFELLRGSFREGKNVDFDAYKRLFETSFLRIAEIYRENMGEFIKAYETYVLAQEKVEERSSMAKIQMRIGDNYLAWKRYDDAWKAYNDVITLYSDTDYPPNAQYRKGEALYYKGDYDAARKEYMKTLEDYPDADTELLALCMYNTGWSLEKQGKTDEALEIYTQAVDKYERSEQAPVSLLRIARILHERTQNDEAVAITQRIIDNFPDTRSVDDAHYVMGLSLRDKGEKDEALAAFQKVSKESERTYIASLMEAARLSIELKQPEQAQQFLAALLRGVEGKPDLEASAHYQIGWLRASEEKYAEAAKEYGIVIESFPESDVIYDSYYGRGLAHQRLQRFKSALSDYRSILDGDAPDELKLKTKFSMALAYSALGQDQQAMPLLQEVAASGDEDLARSSRLQQVSIAEGRSPREAIRTYEQILADAQDDRERSMILTRLANAYLKLEEYDRSIGAAQQLIGIAEDPESIASAYYVVGNSYYQQQKFRDAIENFQKVVDEYPQTVVALNCLMQQGLSYFNMGTEGIDGSIDAFTKFYTKYPYNDYAPAAYYYTSWGYYRKGTWDQAAASFLGLVKRFPDDKFAAEALFRAGEALFNQRQYTEAYDLYQRVLSEKSDSRWVSNALYNQAWCLVRQDLAEEAVPIFREVVAQYKDTDLAENSQFSLGDHYYSQEQYDLATQEYTRFIELYPSSKFVSRAKILLEHLDEITAYNAYREGEILFDQEQYDEAIEIFRQVIDQYPTSDSAVSSLVNVGAAYQSKEDFKRAAEAYDELVSKYGENPKYASQVDFARAQLNMLRESKAI